MLKRIYHHFSHYIVPEAKRIGLSRYTDRLDLTAFQNPDGRLVLVAHNRSNTTVPVNLRLHGQVASFVVMPGTIVTGIISEKK